MNTHQIWNYTTVISRKCLCMIICGQTSTELPSQKFELFHFVRPRVGKSQGSRESSRGSRLTGQRRGASVSTVVEESCTDMYLPNTLLLPNTKHWAR